MAPFAPLVLFLACLLVASPSEGVSQELRIAPRFEVGDGYSLDLTSTTVTEAAALTRLHPETEIEEDVALHYSARVLVLATDGNGTPTREHHSEVRLDMVRPGELASLFGEGTNYRVHRLPDGGCEIFVRGQRVQRDVEDIIREILRGQLDFAIARALQPDSTVRVGQEWNLQMEPILAFLSDRGLRVREMAGPAQARLLGKTPDGSSWLVAYRVPVSGFDLERLPRATARAVSHGLLDGSVRIPADGTSRATDFTLRLSTRLSGTWRHQGVAPTIWPAQFRGGSITKPGQPSRTIPWSLRSRQSIAQRSTIFARIDAPSEPAATPALDPGR